MCRQRLTASRLAVPEAVKRRGVEMLESIGDPLLVGDSCEVEGWWIETHTLGCRNAADEPEQDWWISHWAIFDEYEADHRSATMGDPGDGKFVTLMCPASD